MLLVASVLVYTGLRRAVVLAPLAVASVHLVVALRLVPAPRSALEWGATCIGLGFVLLVLPLVVSVRWRHRMAAAPVRGTGEG